MIRTAVHVLAVLAFAIAPIAAQEPDAQTPQQETTPPGIEAANEVEVTLPTDDGAIATRLRRVLDATERYAEIDVRVRDGVAVLTGTVAAEEDRRWLIDLTKQTESVVAVLDHLEVVEPPWFDMRPAVGELESMARGIVSALPRLTAGLLVLLLFTLIAAPLAGFLGRAITRRISSQLLQSVIQKSMSVLVWIFGAYLFLRITGLTQIAATVIGGTGILGIVLGFAFRDIAENFLASVLLSLQRPFRYGDTVEIQGHLGVLQRVTPRGTVLMDFEGNFVQIPNAEVYKGVLKNYTANPNVRTDFAVGIGYDAGIERSQVILMGVLESHPAVLDDPGPMVLVESLDAATITLRAYFWVNGIKHSKLKVRSAVMRIALQALQDAGVSLPDDAREVLFPDGVPVRMLDADAPVTTPRDEAAPPPRRAAELEPETATEAEGDLSSDADEVQEQANNARQPEEGESILSGEATVEPSL